MRSVTGCLTCRRRKLKCDEKKPECGQCRKAGRSCEAGELVFRHQQNSSLGRESRRDGLNKYFARRSSFSTSETWVPIPENVSFVTENPAGSSKALPALGAQQDAAPTGGTPTPIQQRFHDGQAGVSRRSGGSAGALTPGSSPSIDASSPRSVRSSLIRRDSISYGAFEQSTGSPDARPSTYIDFILNPTPPGLSFEGGVAFVQPDTSASPRSQGSRASKRAQIVETDPKVAFLLRHFSQKPGKWLDLYFSDAYFELDVPLKALSHPLLKCAACAYAAKHLDRTRGKTDSPRTPLRHSTVATTATWPKSDDVDWAWYASKYYAEAIKLLRETLQRTHQDLQDSPGEQTSSNDGSDIQSIEQSAIYARIDDETLAAMAILCNFEFMSASDLEWDHHLNGTLLVLDLRQTGVISLMSSPPSKARKAIFWNLFRQDTFAAFILEGRTRMDIEDLRMWRAAGLELDDRGFVLPSTGAREGVMKDDMISNALIWILSKVINYIAAVKEVQQRQAEQNQLNDEPLTTPDLHDTPWTLKDKWKAISHELDVWYEGLPDSFRPCARIERKATEPATESSPLKPATIPDIWFTSAMCASTVQTYHLARMLLLVHRPQSSDQALRTGAIFDFLKIYRTIEAELRHRCREIFGIALSSPTTSITLHQTQTIFVAAQCLVEDDERHMALDILRRVNSDLGWETEYRVQQLLKEWGWGDV